MSEENFNLQNEEGQSLDGQPEHAEAQPQINPNMGSNQQDANQNTGTYQQEMNQKPESYQQNSYQDSNQYYQQNNNPNYGSYPVNEPPVKKDSTVFGLVSMILGILSLALFCACINFPLAIAAIVFGILQIVKYKSKGMAIAGLITGGVSILAGIVFWMIMVTSSSFQNTFWNEFYDVYDHNGYSNEYFDDTFDDTF